MDGIVSHIVAMSGNAAELPTLHRTLLAADGALAAGVDAIPAALQQLTPGAHSLGAVHLLLALANAPKDAAGGAAFVSLAGAYLRAASPAQVCHAPSQLVDLGRRFKEAVMAAGAPRLGVAPLLAAAGALAGGRAGALTPLHADALHLCILAKTYAAAAPLLGEDIAEVDPAATCVTGTDLQLYCLYGGMICTARRELRRALELYLQARCWRHAAPAGV